MNVRRTRKVPHTQWKPTQTDPFTRADVEWEALRGGWIGDPDEWFEDD